MTFEADLKTTIAAAVPALGSRVFPDFAPVSTSRPYATFQQFGGDVINPMDNIAPGLRMPYVLVNVWSDTRAEALQIARAIEDAMRAATFFFGQPMSDLACDYEADLPAYGTRQDFRCRHTT